MPRFCENCGGVVRDDEKACPHCGFTEAADESSSPLMTWMTQGEGGPPQDENRGSLEDLRRKYGKEKGDKGKDKDSSLGSLFKGAFASDEVYSEGEGDRPEAPDQEREDIKDTEDTSYSYQKDLPSPAYAAYRDEEDDYEDDYEDDIEDDEEIEDIYSEDESMYDDDSSFLKKIIIVCGILILIAGFLYLGVRYFAQETQGTEAGLEETQEKEEAVKDKAQDFFAGLLALEGDRLDDQASIYFGNYQKDEDALSQDLSVLAGLLEEDLVFAEAEYARVTGSTAAVKMKMEGPQEAVDLLGESKFVLFGQDWKFDFAFFAAKLEEEGLAGPGQEAEGDESEGQEAGFTKTDLTDQVSAFNEAWIDYVNTGRQDVFNYLQPASSAYRRIAKADVQGLEESLLEHRLSDVTIDGEKGQLTAYEKYKKTRDGRVTIAEYDWRYELVYEEGQWLISDYRSIDKPEPTPEPTPQPEKDPEEKPEGEADKPAEESGTEEDPLPEGFSQDKTYEGGAVGGGDRIAGIRFSSATNRLVIDFTKGSDFTDTLPPYRLTASDQGIRISLDNLVKEDLSLPATGGLLKGIALGPSSEEEIQILIKLEEGTYYKAFSLASNQEKSARLVVDFIKP